MSIKQAMSIKQGMSKGHAIFTRLVLFCLLTIIMVLCSTLFFYSGAQPMIILKMCTGGCGLGNQMFIYASGLGIAQKYSNTFTCVNDLEDTVNALHPLSALVLNVDILVKPLPPCSIETVRGIGYDWWWLIGLKWTSFLGLTTRFRPPHTMYTPFLFDERRPAILDASLESYKYFRHVQHPIFVLKQYNQARAWLAARNITSVVHVRRGDKISEGHPVPPIQYYERALRQVGTGHVAVCTDDPAWVMQQQVFENASISIHNNPGFDMALLTAATDTVIIGIGTFGWWGAYLSKAKRKLIYSIQFGPEKADQYRELDYIPYNVQGQGDWISLE